MSHSPTMNDVARVAQVALKTVSRYVNGATNIDPVLSDRIAAAIEELGYRRNLAAASIRPGWTSKMVGLIVSDLANPYYSVLARAIEEELGQAGYMLIVASSEEDGGRHDRLVDRLIEQRVDGLIIVPPQHAGRDWASIPPPIPPIVFLDRPGSHVAADTVLTQNVEGAATATKALLDTGAKNVAFVGDSLEIFTIRERYRGYEQALIERGLEPDPRLRFDTAHSSEQATIAVDAILADGTADAVFAANNRASIGALLSFNAHDRHLPLIGFDDFEAAPLSSPPVSVVGPDMERMGKDAAVLLLARLRGTDAPFAEHVLSADLILRGSERAR
ncbi:LacI family DNA-binding transcriptional regulator [Compostimonas suwonensis]|uniref:LacI family transcriptional regulator n=1 Tax=Compostimonas suwonensis TaxID=1048394 RepID=A0A2M9BCW3_9MICO|nr:LacI family DNA-binding transcriptional regulator [Compostimonas suwonensis]PJJ55791.1 LacI family transcriptional regulator [Compostimonas suwonensis]